MSNSRTGRTSTTASSSSSPSPPESTRTAVIACGAIAQPCGAIATRRGWPVDVYPLPPLLHNAPAKIAGEVEELALRLLPKYEGRLAVAYADCGTYGALDGVCERLGISRLAGLHCYDVYAGAEALKKVFEDQPGTYVLTDFLVRSFHRSVLVELGLDRYPDLRDAYFEHYTRVVWLAQDHDAELQHLAEQAAEALGLPLTTVDVGYSGLERSLEALLAYTGAED